MNALLEEYDDDDDDDDGTDAVVEDICVRT